MPDLQRRLRALTPIQRALLARRLDATAAGEPQLPSPAPARLVAYVVPRTNAAPSASSVRGFLKAHVPDFMVPSAVVVLDELPRMPNGKIDRRALPAPGAADPFEVADVTPPRNPTEEQLAAIWAEVLGIEVIGVYDNFFEIGGDSILSIQIISRANQAGLRLKPSQFFEYPTIASLASVAGTTETSAAAEPAAPGPVPLTPIQHWFFERSLPDPSHWNQVVAFDVARAVDTERLERALHSATRLHDAFRLRFTREPGGWTQVLAPTDADGVSVAHYDLSEHPPGSHEQAIERIWAESQNTLDLAAGPLLHVALIDRGLAAPYRMILTGHHLVVDVISWQTFIRDVEAIYLQLGSGKTPKLASPGTSFSRWADALRDHAHSAALQAERGYWFDQAAHTVAPLPTDGSGPNTVRSARTLTRALDRAETQALSDATAAYGMKIPELVLTALAGTLTVWSGAPHLRIDLEGHGRADLADTLDVTRAVGWFTTVYPVLLRPGSLGDPRQALTNVKEQLRRVPRQGIGYGLLRYSSDDPERHRLGAPAEVLFNYAGHAYPQFDEGSPFRAPVAIWGSRGPDGVRAHLIEIDSLISDGSFTMHWTYSRDVHRLETVERLVHDTHVALKALVTHCAAPEAGGYTPSDFPDIDLSQDGLDLLLDGLQ